MRFNSMALAGIVGLTGCLRASPSVLPKVPGAVMSTDESLESLAAMEIQSSCYTEGRKTPCTPESAAKLKEATQWIAGVNFGRYAFYGDSLPLTLAALKVVHPNWPSLTDPTVLVKEEVMTPDRAALLFQIQKGLMARAVLLTYKAAKFYVANPKRCSQRPAFYGDPLRRLGYGQCSWESLSALRQEMHLLILANEELADQGSRKINLHLLQYHYNELSDLLGAARLHGATVE